jgi:PAS domain S-box-containing protein
VSSRTLQINKTDKTPRWHRLYYALAAFDVITVLISLTLNHMLMDTFTGSVDTNQEWADRLGSYAEINALAQKVNAPGNDVFDTQDVSSESARLHEALTKFNVSVKAARVDLKSNVDAAFQEDLQAGMGEVEVAMQEMVAEATNIFQLFDAGQGEEAGTRMATMDRKYAAVTVAIGLMSQHVRSIQTMAFDEQIARAASLKRVEYLIGGMIVLMVVAVGVYGHKIQRAMANAISASKERTQQLNETVEHAQSIAHELSFQKKALDEHAIVSITDIRGDIEYVNDLFCTLSGYERSEMIGSNHRLVKSDEHSLPFYRELWKTVTKGDTWRGQIRNKCKDGSFYWVDATIVPFRGKQGQIEKYVAIRTDITAIKELEAQQELAKRHLVDALEDAEFANRSKSEFLANMSHEIRTPMTAILGFAEMISENATTPEVVDGIETIQRNGKHLLAVINDILDISKIEAGKMTVESLPCNPVQEVSDVVGLMRKRAEAKGLVLTAEFVGEFPELVQSDPIRLRQILINLLGNAIKFTEEGGVKLICQLVQDGALPHLQFDIRDTGIGMTHEQASNLFQPFSQADSSTTRKYGGSGLGLTISKRFAGMLGGNIVLTETELGIGSNFRVTIATGLMDGVEMVKDPYSITTSGKTKPPAPISDLTGVRVLLVEDGLDNQRLISFILKKAGVVVTVVENGKLGLDAALGARNDGRPFDCILMDMQMPVMDGYQATVALRNASYTAPIIALTANAMSGDRDKCINAGCNDFASKPIDRAALINMVARYGRRSSAAA